MKNNKLRLGGLKVQSFVTSMNGEESETVKGGASVLSACPTGYACDTGHNLCTPTYGSTCDPNCHHTDACAFTEESFCRP